MKKIISILAALVMCFTLTSCVTHAQAQVDDMYSDDIDISVVVSYGTPYYNAEGLLLYYIYRDMFYYPYYYHNRYYLHRYSRPLPPRIHRDRYRPAPRDFYRNNRPNHGHNALTPPPSGRGSHSIKPNHQRNTVRPNTNQIPRASRSIPSTAPRSSTRATVGGGNHSFGGHRGHVGGRR